jgi:hypothetical protein
MALECSDVTARPQEGCPASLRSRQPPEGFRNATTSASMARRTPHSARDDVDRVRRGGRPDDHESGLCRRLVRTRVLSRCPSRRAVPMVARGSSATTPRPHENRKRPVMTGGNHWARIPRTPNKQVDVAGAWSWYSAGEGPWSGWSDEVGDECGGPATAITRELRDRSFGDRVGRWIRHRASRFDVLHCFT